MVNSGAPMNSPSSASLHLAERTIADMDENGTTTNPALVDTGLFQLSATR
jgi:hypothetical protein